MKPALKCNGSTPYLREIRARHLARLHRLNPDAVPRATPPVKILEPLPLPPPPPPPPPPPECGRLKADPEMVLSARLCWEVMEIVARVHGQKMSADDIKGRSRIARLVLARYHVIQVLSTLRPDCSLSKLGRLMGGRDHSTMIYARSVWKKTEARIGVEKLAAVEAAVLALSGAE